MTSTRTNSRHSRYGTWRVTNVDVGGDGLPLLTHSELLEYLMQWNVRLAQNDFARGGDKLNLFCSPQQLGFVKSTWGRAFIKEEPGLGDFRFDLPHCDVFLRAVAGHRGLTLAPQGDFVTMNEGGVDTFDVVGKLLPLLKLESCRPVLPKGGPGFRAGATVGPLEPDPIPSVTVVQIREAGHSLITLKDYVLKTSAVNYHHALRNRDFIFQLHLRRASDNLTEVVFDFPDPFRRVHEPDENDESFVLANLRANEAEW